MTTDNETPDTRTHRCIECPPHVEHYQVEISPIDGRCVDHSRYPVPGYSKRTKGRTTDA